MAKINKQSLVDQIYARLRQDILTRELPLGSRINVNEIQQELGVSSTPLREALNRLQQDGLVVLETNIGASILSLDAHDVEEIEELAYTLQSAAVHFSLERGDRAVMLREIEEQLARYAQTDNPHEGMQAVFELIGSFYHHCGNRRLDNSMIAFQGQVLLLRHIYAECPGSLDNLDLLQQICDGVRENDEQRILAALWEYSQRSRAAIIRWLDEQ